MQPLRTDKRDKQVDLRVFKLDLHIHTVLSPCTEIADMTPKAIVREALEKELDMVAVCDHNSARNTAATMRAASGSRLTVIPGMEISSVEEVHFLGLFPTDEHAAAAQEEVYSRLFGENQESVFGCQVVVDEFDLVEDLDNRLLISSTTMNAEKVVDLIHACCGLAIACHIDRQAYSIFTQLGFIPPNLRLDALEVSRRTDFESVRKKYSQCADHVLVTSSDAHYLEDIGAAYTLVRMAEPTFEELKKALACEDGRQVLEGKRREKRRQ